MAEESVKPEELRKVDKYDLIGVIAQGNSTQIWEANDGHQSWALKVLLPEKLEDADQRNVMKHEAGVLKAMEHPSFVRYRESAVSKKSAYIVMEYFRAPNLKSQIATDSLGLQSRFPKLLEQICLALAYMHERGWVHRDLKPDNILLNKAGEMRLIDFSLSTRFKTGLAKAFAGKSKIIQGTRTYIAPETILKQQPTPQTDMYSLGITFYELLTGKTPFTGASPQDLLKKHVAEKPIDPSWVNPNLTSDADQFLQRLLKKKPADRFGSTNEMFAEARTLKFFKEDPGMLLERQKESNEALKEVVSYEQVLDSRADAARTAAGIKLAPRERKPAPKAAASPQQKPQPQPQQPSAPQMPQYPPGYAMPPGYPYPQQPNAQGQPMYPMPQYPPAGYPYPQQFPPGYPQSPGTAPAPPAEQTAVPQPPANAPLAPAPQPQSAGPPDAPPETPPPAEKKQSPESPAKKKGEDLPLMDELPDVI